MKNAPADPQHHRAMSDDQLLEGRLRGLVARDTIWSRSCASDIVPTAPKWNSRCTSRIQWSEDPLAMPCDPMVIDLLQVVPAHGRLLTKLPQGAGPKEFQSEENRRNGHRPKGDEVDPS